MSIQSSQFDSRTQRTEAGALVHIRALKVESLSDAIVNGSVGVRVEIDEERVNGEFQLTAVGAVELGEISVHERRGALGVSQE